MMVPTLDFSVFLLPLVVTRVARCLTRTTPAVRPYQKNSPPAPVIFNFGVGRGSHSVGCAPRRAENVNLKNLGIVYSLFLV